MRFIIWHSKLQAEGNDVAMACWKNGFQGHLICHERETQFYIPCFYKVVV
jgi:hypothetical protein